MKQKIKHSLLLILFLGLMTTPLLTHAGGFVICGDHGSITAEHDAAQAIVETPKINYDQFVADTNTFDRNTCKLPDLFNLASLITNFLIGAAGVFAVGRILLAGIQITIDANTGNGADVKKQQDAIVNAILGVVIVMIAFVCINTVFTIFAVQIGASSKYSFPYNPYST